MSTRLAIVLLLFFNSSIVSGQDKKPKVQPNSIDPTYAEENYVPKTSKKKKKFGATYEARNDFQERMEKNWKKREKEEKNFSGKRSADKSLPPYFGHKRPPKIRPPEKQKICKVCGIKH